jgi:hypothetical protein
MVLCPTSFLARIRKVLPPFHFFSCLSMSSSFEGFVFASGGKYVFLVSQIFLGVQAMEINGT